LGAIHLAATLLDT